MAETEGLGSITLKEASQLLILPKSLRNDLEKRKKLVHELEKENDQAKISDRFTHLDRVLSSHQDFLKEQLGNLVKLEKAKTGKKEESVVIMHLIRQARIVEEYMENIRRQRNLLKSKKDKDLVLSELQKEMTQEESIIRKIEYYFEKISAANKSDIAKFKKENPSIAPHQGPSFNAVVWVVAVILFILLIIFFLKFFF